MHPADNASHRGSTGPLMMPREVALSTHAVKQILCFHTNDQDAPTKVIGPLCFNTYIELV